MFQITGWYRTSWSREQHSEHMSVQNFKEQGETFRAQVGTELQGSGSNIQGTDSTGGYRNWRSRSKQHSGHRCVQNFKELGATFRIQVGTELHGAATFRAHVGIEPQGAGSNIQGTGGYITSRSRENYPGHSWMQNLKEQQGTTLRAQVSTES